MKIIYEEETEVEIEGKLEKKYNKVSQSKATHKHKCYHDEAKPRPCRRVKL